MIETIFKNIAYLYYPKGISNIENREMYLSSIEYIRLTNIIDNFHNNTDKNNLLISKLKKHPLLHSIKDVTLLEWQDRALSFEMEIVKNGNKLVKICLNISLIIPYYIVYVLENEIKTNPYKWVTLPKRSEKLELTDYNDHLKLISRIVEEETKFSAFPKNISNIVLPDICFNDIKMGEFTFFNTFFIDKNYI